LEELLLLTEEIQEELEQKDRKRLIFRYDRKIPDYFSVVGAP